MTALTLETNLSHDFFRQDAATVAAYLLGRQLIRTFSAGPVVTGTLVEISAWEGGSGKFVDYGPGIVSVSNRRGNYLIDISCGVSSCVTLVAADYVFEDRPVTAQGPGNLAKALQIDASFDGHDLIAGGALALDGNPVHPSLVVQRKKSTPNNCVGYFYIPKNKR